MLLLLIWVPHFENHWLNKQTTHSFALTFFTLSPPLILLSFCFLFPALTLLPIHQSMME